MEYFVVEVINKNDQSNTMVRTLVLWGTYSQEHK